MEVYEISPAVNRVANDGPALHEPYSADTAEPLMQKSRPFRKARAPIDTGQGSLF